MSYLINKTDGTLLVDLIDGILDTETTDLSLVGRNYTGFGEAVNENFIKLLENFANTNQPAAPLIGQLWYDKSENKLKVFDGENFQSAAGSFISETQPLGPIPGDTWFSTVGKQFYLYTGEAWQLIGPAYSEAQGESGIVVDTIDDQNLNKVTILKLLVDNSLVAVISAVDITPNQLPANIIQGLVTATNPTGEIFKGWNILDKDNFKYRGTAEKSENLISATGEIVPESRLVKNDEDTLLTGEIQIRNDAGLTIGQVGNTRFLVDNGFTIRNTREGDDFNIIVNSSAASTDALSAIKIKPNTKRIGLFQANPQYELDVTGNCRITGDLIVEGSSITAEVETLVIEDHNLELGATVSPTDATATGGGIILKGATDKTIIWDFANANWTSSEHWNLATGKEFRINNTTVLNSTTLGSGVINSNLQNLGTLTQLNVDSTRIDGSTLSRTSGSGFTISVGLGDINVSNSKITSLAEPTADSHATPKIYVDRTVQTEPIVFSMDMTGYVVGEFNDRLIDLLNQLYPPTAFAYQKEARIACYYYGPQQTDAIDIAAATPAPQTVEVNTTAGGQANVITGINLPNSLTPAFTLNITRETTPRYFIINALGNWIVKP
jgi:hypothetical protein